MAQQLKLLASLPVDAGSILSTQVAAHNSLVIPVPGDQMPSSGLLQHQACTWYTNIHTQAKHPNSYKKPIQTYKNKKQNKTHPPLQIEFQDFFLNLILGPETNQPPVSADFGRERESQLD